MSLPQTYHVVYPRRSTSQLALHRKPKIYITSNKIQSLFHLRQTDAARMLGISLTALKNACKRLRIPKWPYKRTSDSGDDHNGARDAQSGSSSSTAPPAPSSSLTSEKGERESTHGRTWTGGRGGPGMETLLEEALEHAGC